ncbi:hypothetical protein CDL15_Pgr021777 [Punica granatum]|uniref:DNA-directed RNA polymerase III subunit RPC3 n=1 Tax=Punica granatum TaxID=22663 RepID=A0A218WUG9_PUNGR|nr:hypothetical protein CDL15_Pgr021777 [Punica granatum]
MATQWGIKYAVHIVSSHFGDLAAKICECLLRRGPLSQQNIARFLETPPSQVKTCLLLLIQQNLVQAFTAKDPGGHGDAVKQTTEYIALFDNIIHRTRFPKFIIVVSQELEKGCVELFEGLLQHGRLTLEKLIDRAKSGKQNSNIENAVRENLSKLVHAHFVERCPAIEPVLAPPSEDELAAKKRASRSLKIAAGPDIVQRVLEAAAPMESKRFLFMSDENCIDSEKAEASFVDVGEKRKHSLLASDSDLGIKEEVLWRANYEEFLRRFRHKACVENVRERLDDGAAIALSSMLEAGRRLESKLKTETSVSVSINAIYEEAMKAEVGRSMTLDDLRDYLTLLECQKGADESYSIDLKSILELAQNEEVESIVLKKYGKDSYRIFRLLSKEGHLVETDKISDTAFVDKKEAPKILYKLWKDEYVYMQKVTVMGNRQSQFVLWKVNKATLWKNVENDMYHAALNLSLRVAHEMEQGKELLSLPVEKRVGTLGEKVNRLRRIRLVLEESLSKLDDAIMLFHVF